MKNIFLKSIGVIVILYGVIGFLLLPYYLQINIPKILEQKFSIKTYIDSIHFNPFSFEVTIDSFILEDQKKKDILFFETLYFDLELLGLLQNKVHLEHLKIDNFRVDLDLDKNKVPNFQYILDAFFNKSNGSKDDSVKNRLFPFFEIDKLDLTYLNTLFKDNSKKEPYTIETKPFNINLENIAVDPNHINKIHFTIDTKQSGTIVIDSQLIFEPFYMEGEVSLSNINVNKKFNYFKTENKKFDLNSKQLHGSFGYKLKMVQEDMILNISDITLEIAKIQLFQNPYKLALDELKTAIKTIDINLSNGLDYKVKDIKLDVKEIDFIDKNISKNFIIRGVDFNLKQATSKKDEPIKFTSSFNMPVSGILKTDGSFLQEPLNLVLDMKLQNTTLKPYEKYLQKFVNLGIDSFFINLNSSFQYTIKDEKSDIQFNGDATLEKIALSNTQQKQKILDIKKATIDTIVYKNHFLDIKNVAIDKPFIYVNFNKNKTTNFSSLVKKIQNKEKNKMQKEDNTFGFIVKKLTVNDGDASIIDKVILPHFKTKEEKINIVVNNLSINPKIRTEIFHKSVMDKYSPVRAKGKLKLKNPLDDLEMSVELKNIDLPSLSMYSGKFIGNKIANGKLSLDLQHTIKNKQLKTMNNIQIKDLELGEKVESKDAIDAPIGLAIALLEDSSGMINLDIPVQGDLKSPKFDISDAISDVIVNTLTSIVTAPFKFLAMLTGLDGKEDISKVGFIYGSTQINPTQKEKLDAIAKALIERPHLQIKIKPAYYLENDKKALLEKKFKKTYPVLNDTTKKFQELYKITKEQFIKIYSAKEYNKLQKSKDQNYSYMIKKLKQQVKIELSEIESLAKNRAIALKEYLVEHGVVSNRIEIKKSYTTNKVDKKLNQVIVLFELDAK